MKQSREYFARVESMTPREVEFLASRLAAAGLSFESSGGVLRCKGVEAGPDGVKGYAFPVYQAAVAVKARSVLVGMGFRVLVDLYSFRASNGEVYARGLADGRILQLTAHDGLAVPRFFDLFESEAPKKGLKLERVKTEKLNVGRRLDL